jgi:hypothetical protein
MSMRLQQPDAQTMEFCRDARRLRATGADSPRELHQRLQTLTVRPSPRRITPAPEMETEHVRLRFAREVTERLDGPLLRYSMRLDLHRLARRLGISIFDANLIIAQVQHASGAPITAASPAPEPNAPTNSAAGKLAMLLAVLVTQAAIVGAGWALLS